MIWLVYIFGFVIGTAIGSFLNVCIYRLPREMSVVSPGSHCPTCGQALAWYDNVPIISFILLGGGCRHCGVIISGRYALVELLTGLLFVAALSRLGWEGGFNAAQVGVALVVVPTLIAASFIDIERQIIPDEITLPGIAVGCLAGLVLPQIHAPLPGAIARADPLLHIVQDAVPAHLYGLIASVAGAAIGAGFIYLTGVAGKMIFRKEAMGLGDVKLMAMVGAFIGWQATLMSIFLGCFYGAIIGIIIIFVMRRKDSRIPFGPYLSLGVVSIIFLGPQLIGAYHWWQQLITAG